MVLQDLDEQTNHFFVNQIIFITDGEVENTKDILLNVNKLNNLNIMKKISIFAFGVG